MTILGIPLLVWWISPFRASCSFRLDMPVWGRPLWVGIDPSNVGTSGLEGFPPVRRGVDHPSNPYVFTQNTRRPRLVDKDSLLRDLLGEASDINVMSWPITKIQGNT